MINRKNNGKSQTLSELSPEVRPFVEKLAAHWKEITAAVLGVLFVVFMFLGYRVYEQKKLKKEKELISKVLETKDIDNRIKGLKELLLKVSDRYKPSIYMNLALLYFQKKEYSNLSEVIKEFRKLSWIDDGLKVVASLILAKSLSLQNNFKDALKITEDLLKEAPQQFQQVILWDMAFYAEKTGNWKVALYAYSRLKELKDVANKDLLEEKIMVIRKKMEKKEKD